MPASAAGRGTLVNPAGAIDQFDVEAFKRAIDINMTATLMAMRFAVPHMKQRRSGSIVATASIAGIRAEPITGYGYIASKAAVINIVRQAAVELAPYNIRVNAIAPGPFLTNIGGGRLHRDPETVKLFADMVPLGRLAKTDEIKGLALLLASPAGSYLTGTVHSDRRRRHSGDDARVLLDRRAARRRECRSRLTAKAGKTHGRKRTNRRRVSVGNSRRAGASSSR